MHHYELAEFKTILFLREFVDSIPLLDASEDSSSDDEGLRITMRNDTPQSSSRINQNKPRMVDDNFYLVDQRKWTNVRDAHLEMSTLGEK